MISPLCIGGPLDGKRIDAQGDRMQAFASYPPRTGPDGLVETVNYNRERFRLGWREEEFWVIAGMTLTEMKREIDERRLM